MARTVSTATRHDLLQAVKDRSTNPPALRIDGQEVVLLDAPATTSSQR